MHLSHTVQNPGRVVLEKQLAAIAARTSLGPRFRKWELAGHTAVHLANLDRLFVLYTYKAGKPEIVQVYEVTAIEVGEYGLSADFTDQSGWTTTVSHSASELDTIDSLEGYGVFLHIPFMAETSYKPSLSDPEKYIFKVPVCVKQTHSRNYPVDGAHYLLPAADFKPAFPELADQVV